jgi:hypothetical protein
VLNRVPPLMPLKRTARLTRLNVLHHYCNSFSDETCNAADCGPATEQAAAAEHPDDPCAGTLLLSSLAYGITTG